MLKEISSRPGSNPSSADDAVDVEQVEPRDRVAGADRDDRERDRRLVERGRNAEGA